MVKKIDYLDVLNLTWKQEKELICRIEASGSEPDSDERRASPRRMYVVKGGVLLTLNNMTDDGRPFRAIPRDLSEGGIGLLHSSYLYQDTPVTVTFLLDANEHLEVQGRVRHCDHVEGKVHKVGVKFDAPLSAGTLFEAEDDVPEAVRVPEERDKARHLFAGKALYVEDDPMYQRMVGPLFERMGIEVDVVEDWKSAIDVLMGGRFDALLIPMPVEGDTGATVVRALRGRGIKLPIVALAIGAVGGNEDAAGAAIEMGCTEVLGRPLTFSKVKQVVTRVLGLVEE